MMISDVHDDYEIIEGVKLMAPSPSRGHVNVKANLVTIINNYARINKLGVVIADKKAKMLFEKKDATLHGVPDMIAEVFSKSTMKRDLGIKKDIYEKKRRARILDYRARRQISAR